MNKCANNHAGRFHVAEYVIETILQHERDGVCNICSVHGIMIWVPEIATLNGMQECRESAFVYLQYRTQPKTIYTVNRIKHPFVLTGISSKQRDHIQLNDSLY